MNNNKPTDPTGPTHRSIEHTLQQVVNYVSVNFTR